MARASAHPDMLYVCCASAGQACRLRCCDEARGGRPGHQGQLGRWHTLLDGTGDYSGAPVVKQSAAPAPVQHVETPRSAGWRLWMCFGLSTVRLRCIVRCVVLYGCVACCTVLGAAVGALHRFVCEAAMVSLRWCGCDGVAAMVWLRWRAFDGVVLMAWF